MPPTSNRSAMLPKTPSAFVSDPTITSSWRGALVVSAMVAVVAALAVATRVLWLGEAFSDRTRLLMLIAAEGGFAAMLVAAFPALWVAGNWLPWLRALLGAIITGMLFIPATMFFFALKIRVIDGRIEADAITDLGPIELFWSLFGAMGMFTPTGLRYLAPGAVLAVSATALFVLFRWPRATSR
jgi:hypothetical protein